MARAADNIIEAKGALILGAGIAGLFTALKLAPFPALVLAGARPGTGSSAWAQGGIAAAMGPDDSWQAHAADTMAAGRGHCDPAMVELRRRRGPGAHRRSDRPRRAVRPRTGRDAWRWAARPRIRPTASCMCTGDRAGAEVTPHAGRARPGNARPSRSSKASTPSSWRCEDGRVAGLFARYGHGRERAAGAVPRAGRDLRHRRARRALLP